MQEFPFDTAPRSFSRGKRVNPDGAFWAYTNIVAGSVGLGMPPVHRWGLDWKRCFESLGVAFGRHELRRLELHVAQQGWAKSPIARRGECDVVERVQIGADGEPVESTRSIEVRDALP